MARRRRSGSSSLSIFIAATWPTACTPVSVREDPWTETGWLTIVAAASVQTVHVFVPNQVAQCELVHPRDRELARVRVTREDEWDAVLPTDTRQLVRPAGAAKAVVKVVQLGLGDVDAERPDLGGGAVGAVAVRRRRPDGIGHVGVPSGATRFRATPAQ